MSVDTAAADRLPWLADEAAPQQEKRSVSPLPWAGATIAVVAAGAFWMGARSVQQPAQVPTGQSSTTVQLPPPAPVSLPEVRLPPQPEVQPTPVQDVHPSPVKEVRLPPVERSSGHPSAKTPAEASRPAAATVTTAPATAVAQPGPELINPKPWNPRFAAGAKGRLVQIGAFGSVHQAKRGWWFMVHDYPAMAHLPSVVRQTRNSHGRAFYRFDVGTTSQAHSEVLCQRMEKIQLSCAVIGLPWKAKVER